MNMAGRFSNNRSEDDALSNLWGSVEGGNMGTATFSAYEHHPFGLVPQPTTEIRRQVSSEEIFDFLHQNPPFSQQQNDIAAVHEDARYFGIVSSTPLSAPPGVATATAELMGVSEEEIRQQHIIAQTIAWEQIQKQQEKDRKPAAKASSSAWMEESKKPSSASSSSSTYSQSQQLQPQPPVLVDTDDSVSGVGGADSERESAGEDGSSSSSSDHHHHPNIVTATNIDNTTVQLAEERLSLGQCPACGQQLYKMTKQSSNNKHHKRNGSYPPGKTGLWKCIFSRGGGSNNHSKKQNDVGRNGRDNENINDSLRASSCHRPTSSTEIAPPVPSLLQQQGSKKSNSFRDLYSKKDDDDDNEDENDIKTGANSKMDRPSLPRHNSTGNVGHRQQQNNKKNSAVLVRQQPLHIPGLVHRGQCVKCSTTRTIEGGDGTNNSANNNKNQEEDENVDLLFLRDDEFATEDDYLRSSILQPLAASSNEDQKNNKNNVHDDTVPDAPALATYTGPVDAKGERHGMGTLTWSNGDVYQGHFVHGVRQGPGTLTFGNGRGEYVGDWADNTMHGQGTRRYPNGDLYTGPYHQGQRHGPNGRFYFANGDLYVGHWQHDQMHGFGRYYYHHGQRFEGDFVCGQRHGKGKLQRLDGTLDIYRYRSNERAINTAGVRWSPDRRKTWKLTAVPVNHKFSFTTSLSSQTTATPQQKSFTIKKQAIPLAEAVGLVYEIENYELNCNGNSRGIASQHVQDIPTVAPSNTVI